MLKIASIRTLADLIDDLGVPPDRILFRPVPGTATEQDVIDLDAHEDRLVELIDGVLVEKAMGFEESIVVICIAALLRQHVGPRKRSEYFDAGARLVWIVDHRARTVQVYTNAKPLRRLTRTTPLAAATCCRSSPRR
jgi:hypothetical protein